MAKVIMRVIGIDGQIDLAVDRVVIRREGLWNMLRYGFNSTREIPLGAISEVTFRPANVFLFGQIDFVRSGRSMEERMKNNKSAVRFNKKNQAAFEKLKEKVFEMVEQHTKQRAQ